MTLVLVDWAPRFMNWEEVVLPGESVDVLYETQRLALKQIVVIDVQFFFGFLAVTLGLIGFLRGKRLGFDILLLYSTYFFCSLFKSFPVTVADLVEKGFALIAVLLLLFGLYFARGMFSESRKKMLIIIMLGIFVYIVSGWIMYLIIGAIPSQIEDLAN
jgi:hypothetical protein